MIVEKKLVLFLADLAGYTRATGVLDAMRIATFLDGWYRESTRVLRARGGRVVKFMGDAVLATFPEDACVAAVDAFEELSAANDAIQSDLPMKLALGANIHLAIVAEGEIGGERYDVLGSAVNHLFSMGGGAGLRISEPVYRQLPNDRRSRWRKHQPPATYHATC